ncbi:DUF2281 domain-containing protein [Leptolyngbya sp. NK1-12]|uniref:DUF2281 domain-containing protein n=1 Tax=Leptolyngbya sp. NK1-12 TaxID=2547451 RepID=A0AA96WCH2_9CYAN|nr:DUF2281 domain-containing protein [Leptolyngbya sp. NK1-12]
MQPIQQQILETLQTLSSTEQQEVLDFAKFLRSKQERAINQQPSEQAEQPSISFLEAARDYIGCLEGGPSDLSTNKAYMEGFGEE